MYVPEGQGLGDMLAAMDYEEETEGKGAQERTPGDPQNQNQTMAGGGSRTPHGSGSGIV